jgi:DNA polymerase-3 subunit delta'
MWRTIGHDKAVNTLRRGLQEGRLSHAYLITGPQHVGKMTLALDLAQMVNCLGDQKPCGECRQCKRIGEGLHADVRIVGVGGRGTRDEGRIPPPPAPRPSSPPEVPRSRTLIGIEQVRDVQREASLKPYEGSYRVFIFDGAERLSEEAANCLLKILEEPPEQVIMVLLASESSALLPTIVSRCQQLELRPLPVPLIARELEARYGVAHEKAAEVARLSAGKPGWAFQALSQSEVLERRADKLALIEETMRSGLDERFSYAANLANQFSQSREAVRGELELWLEWWRDALAVKEGVPETVTNISRMDALRTAVAELPSAQIVGVIKSIQETLDHLERNISPRLALEQLMLALPRV